MKRSVRTIPEVAGSVSWEVATNGPPADYEHFPEVRAGISSNPLPSRTGPRIEVTEEQKAQFYRDGFVILKHAVPLELTRDARERGSRPPCTRWHPRFPAGISVLRNHAGMPARICEHV